jgi:hypothetical protein
LTGAFTAPRNFDRTFTGSANFDRTFTEPRDFGGIENAMSALHRNADRTQTGSKNPAPSPMSKARFRSMG